MRIWTGPWKPHQLSKGFGTPVEIIISALQKREKTCVRDCRVWKLECCASGDRTFQDPALNPNASKQLRIKGLGLPFANGCKPLCKPTLHGIFHLILQFRDLFSSRSYLTAEEKKRVAIPEKLVSTQN